MRKTRRRKGEKEMGATQLTSTLGLLMKAREAEQTNIAAAKTEGFKAFQVQLYSSVNQAASGSGATGVSNFAALSAEDPVGASKFTIDQRRGQRKPTANPLDVYTRDGRYVVFASSETNAELTGAALNPPSHLARVAGTGGHGNTKVGDFFGNGLLSTALRQLDGTLNAADAPGNAAIVPSTGVLLTEAGRAVAANGELHLYTREHGTLPNQKIVYSQSTRLKPKTFRVNEDGVEYTRTVFTTANGDYATGCQNINLFNPNAKAQWRDGQADSGRYYGVNGGLVDGNAGTANYRGHLAIPVADRPAELICVQDIEQFENVGVENGMIVGTRNGQRVEIALLQTARVDHPEAMQAIGHGLFRYNAAAGGIRTQYADEEGPHSVDGGCTEESNVDVAGSVVEFAALDSQVSILRRVVSAVLASEKQTADIVPR
ncbi:MAG: hypothetical protein LBJ38_02800 [Oscillospiraceae bacterium]|jgi:flagellar basal body rod protein FlgG|nr:hypothetical protein [Oscillospiraceae bacterium]